MCIILFYKEIINMYEIDQNNYRVFYIKLIALKLNKKCFMKEFYVLKFQKKNFINIS